MTRQGSLPEFDGEDALRIFCHEWIDHPVYRQKCVGTRATILNRPENCAFVLARRHDEAGRNGRNKTWNEEYGGFALSEAALKAFRRQRLQTIVFGVTDEEVAVEYTREQYEQGTEFEWRDGDTQRAVGPPAETAIRVYPAPAVTVFDIEDREAKTLAEMHLKGAGTRRQEDD